MTLDLRPFDPAEYLDTPEAVAEYLAAAFETGEQAVIADALGVVAKARGMTQLSRDTGLARPALYRALSPDGRPEFATVLKVLRALGVRLTPEVAQERPPGAAT
ncbi:addiction module antidote protein [Phenylobacterium sp.]|uniref:addiction module antidote protein n=1 Tax=Phenylobacterium sp. TaxID=1871053 RepID=UPI0037C53D7F